MSKKLNQLNAEAVALVTKLRAAESEFKLNSNTELEPYVLIQSTWDNDFRTVVLNNAVKATPISIDDVKALALLSAQAGVRNSIAGYTTNLKNAIQEEVIPYTFNMPYPKVPQREVIFVKNARGAMLADQIFTKVKSDDEELMAKLFTLRNEGVFYEAQAAYMGDMINRGETLDRLAYGDATKTTKTSVRIPVYSNEERKAFSDLCADIAEAKEELQLKINVIRGKMYTLIEEAQAVCDSKYSEDMSAYNSECSKIQSEHDKYDKEYHAAKAEATNAYTDAIRKVSQLEFNINY